MRYETVQVCHGERLGDIDYGFQFRPHFDCYCTTDEQRDLLCEQKILLLHNIEDGFKRGERVTVATYSDYYHEVIDVGMYDGWPYWKPVPSVCTLGTLGGCEWHSIFSVSSARFAPKLERDPNG
jgi:hypothetical protein